MEPAAAGKAENVMVYGDQEIILFDSYKVVWA